MNSKSRVLSSSKWVIFAEKYVKIIEHKCYHWRSKTLKYSVDTKAGFLANVINKRYFLKEEDFSLEPQITPYIYEYTTSA